jgi:hypothetical protein
VGRPNAKYGGKGKTHHGGSNFGRYDSGNALVDGENVGYCIDTALNGAAEILERLLLTSGNEPDPLAALQRGRKETASQAVADLSGERGPKRVA